MKKEVKDYIKPENIGTKREQNPNEIEGGLSKEDFKKLETSAADVEGDKEKVSDDLKIAYRNIIDILKEYCDLSDEVYNIVALWIIGTYFHKEFISYPFLFFNAMKGSGKTRTMNLVTHLSKDGEMLASLTEAVLFRTTGTLGIDEFEGIQRKGSENLKELLNTCYKKGGKVKRMKQKKGIEGTEQVVEEFEVYRPIVMANIWGMESVLGDRCISLILEKSDKKEIVNLIEIFKEEKIVIETKKLLSSVVSVVCSFSQEAYKEWNNYVKSKYYNTTNNTNYTYNTYNTNYTNYTIPFETIDSMDLNGRELELSFPICLIATLISSGTLKETTLTLKSIFKGKKEEELTDNLDISLYDFVSQEPQKDWIQVKEIAKRFKEFLQSDDEWINAKWIGRALKRLNLIKEKKRIGRGVSIILNIEKAQKKIKMFK
ncbi:hypothetical protein LCGC14_1948210 [marine sediment metagenome]|uniref:DUF3631 domain-containing protein n=1 Tax=marine sediment metagenome TaxID=412755 RepID=A0A0F9G6L8_9ZZZZ